MSPTIGVLAYQGGFQKHIDMLSSLGFRAIQVRDTESALAVQALVMPGGESTTIGVLMERFGVMDVLRRRFREEHMPVFGTCAGTILLADTIIGSQQPALGGLHASVLRNAYGRQIESFETQLDPNQLGERPIPAVFIRAPIIEDVDEDVQVLLKFEDRPVLVRQENILAATFHPELTADTRLHEYFLHEVAEL